MFSFNFHINFVGETLPHLEAPEDPTLATTTEESTEEATLLTGGGQEVSGLDYFP